MFLLATSAEGAAPLTIFKQYYVTGDHASVGKGTRGTGDASGYATADLAIPACPAGPVGPACVPANADIVAAFLYWLTLEKTAKPSAAKGFLLDPDAATQNPPGIASYPITFFGKPVGSDLTAPCWASGGSTGESNGAPSVRGYRGDALRYLELDPVTKKRVPKLRVRLRDSGSSGAGVPLTLGVSLVVVYRHPSLPFKGVVLLDGSFTLNNATDVFDQTIDGFYQAAAGAKAKVTHIAGDGQSNFPERLSFNNGPFEENAFTGQSGYSWDNLTREVSVPENASFLTTKVDHGNGAFDCLSWVAIAASVGAKDTDGDGLLDIWEEQGLKDVTTGAVLINLPAMGATPNVKDLFLEIDYMQKFGANAHSHLPKKEAVDKLGDAFLNAPAKYPNGSIGPIRLHVDLGSNLPASYAGDPYIIPPMAGLEGGDIVSEQSGATFCSAYNPDTCLFPGQPGLVSWKKGLNHIKESRVVTNWSPPLQYHATRRYFSDIRDAVFHYILFAHALAVPGDPLVPGPGFLAKSVSGKADINGGDVVVALGLWKSSNPVDQFVGSAHLQATTMLHEIAHNFGIFHGGTKEGVNCMPHYQSVANYIYQALGLQNAAGVTKIDLSRGVLPAPNEIAPSEAAGVGAGLSLYRFRWYAPAAAAAAALGIPISPASRFCPGKPFGPIPPAGMVRVDSIGLPGVSPVARSPIDWDYDRIAELAVASQDLNFNGLLDVANYAGFDDWSNISMQQVGARRSVLGLSLDVGFQDLLHSGEADLGEADLGEADLGEADLGEADLGEADLGEADLGEADLGEADLGEADLGDLDFETATASANSPSGLKAVVLKTGIELSWDPPPVGSITGYSVYRSTGSAITAPPGASFGAPPGAPVGAPCQAPSLEPPTRICFTDTTVRNNITYTYFATATLDDNGTPVYSGPSNSVTILNK
jgi:hypothetical protein